MTRQRVNSRAAAAARILENLSTVLPLYYDELQAAINHTVGYPDHTPGAPLPTVDHHSVPLEGRCTGSVDYGEDIAGNSHIVTCGRQRPCPEHDHPVTLTVVEHAAYTRNQHRADHNDAEQVLTTITVLAHELLGRARRTIPHQPHPVPRCDATGLDGYLIPRPPHGDGWSDLSCYKPRSRGTLCEACSQREYRWRKAHDMTPRPDGVNAHPKGDETDALEYQRYGLRREP